MQNEIRGLLEEEIQKELQNLEHFESGSDEQTIAVDNVVKLYKLKLEQDKIAMEYLEKIDIEKSKHAQLAENVKDRYVKIGIATVEILLPLMFYGMWMKRGFEFEETGTFTSTTFRGLFCRFKPTIK